MNTIRIKTVLATILLLSSFTEGICRSVNEFQIETSEYIYYYNFEGVFKNKQQVNLKEIHPKSDEKKASLAIVLPDNVVFEGETYDIIRIGGDYYEQIPLFWGWLNESVVSVRLPEKLQDIGFDSFRNCENLRQIIWSDGIRYIEKGAFSNCTGLKSIHIPESVVIIGSYAFQGCTNLQYIYLPEGITEFGDCVFGSCTSLTSISLPSGITEISPDTFKDCTSLTSISLPSGITEIGYEAFKDCKSLRMVNLPSGLKSIGNRAFFGCENLRHMDFPDGLESIWHYAFASTSLESISLPTSVSTFSPLSIIDTPITELHLPAHIIDLGNKSTSLRSLPNIERITIDPANPNYDSRQDCNAIIEKESNTLLCACKNSTIPEGVREIAYQAFEGLGISSITIPLGVQRIRSFAFKDNNLSEIEIPPTVQGIGQDAFKNNKLRKLEIPPSVISIGSAFTDNEIEELILNEGLKSIRSAFLNNPIKDFTIPSTVTEIYSFGNGNYSFIKCKAKVPPQGFYDNKIPWQPVITQCFDFNVIKCPVYVPKGSGEEYASSMYWKGANIIEYVTEGIDDAITDMEAGSKAPIYDLSGRRVTDTPRQGIYIQNGKKYIVK